jgi:hypothetical protein
LWPIDELPKLLALISRQGLAQHMHNAFFGDHSFAMLANFASAV